MSVDPCWLCGGTEELELGGFAGRVGAGVEISGEAGEGATMPCPVCRPNEAEAHNKALLRGDLTALNITKH